MLLSSLNIHPFLGQGVLAQPSTVGAGSFYLFARFAVGFFVWSFLENLETIILLVFIIFRVNVDSSGCLSADHFFGFDVKSDMSARVGMACMGIRHSGIAIFGPLQGPSDDFRTFGAVMNMALHAVARV